MGQKYFILTLSLSLYLYHFCSLTNYLYLFFYFRLFYFYLFLFPIITLCKISLVIKEKNLTNMYARQCILLYNQNVVSALPLSISLHHRFQGGSSEDTDDDEVPAECVSPGSCWPDG